MQLSPHFIYNSLNTIRWMAIINRQENIKAMIDALITLMRTVSSPDAEYTTLASELSLLRSYVYIQQMRFPNFALEVDVPERFGNARINKFVLQNLVENSIVHGFPDRSQTGEVHVSARAEEQDLVLEVRDNGIGFTPTDTRSSDDEEHNHTGIASIQERIFLVHGGNYGLEIESAPGAGTVARVRVPFIALAEEEVECALQ
jgi:sensor histidine kinase YesM